MIVMAVINCVLCSDIYMVTFVVFLLCRISIVILMVGCFLLWMGRHDLANISLHMRTTT